MTIILYENSFVALDFADEYFENRPNSDLWENLTDLQKEKALIFATKKINNFNFIGQKRTAQQQLEFPRNFCPDMPAEIQYAVCEEAYSLIENSAHSKNKQAGISSISMGNTSVSYFDKSNTGVLLSQEAFNFVSKWTEKNFDMR